jgi:hypothetical protein
MDGHKSTQIQRWLLDEKLTAEDSEIRLLFDAAPPLRRTHNGVCPIHSAFCAEWVGESDTI